jgi:YihY family inner membrane protein
MKAVDDTVERVDRYQQGRPWAAFPFAVFKKFGDDRAGNLAALIAYYGFFSLFPLLLVMVAILGFVIRGHPSLRASIINSTLAQFPIIGDQIRHNVKALSGPSAGVGLGVGTAVALWAGLGVTQAAQNALNDIWDVPIKRRPNFLQSRLRGLIMLAVLGTMSLGSTFLSGLGTATGDLGVALRVLGFAGSAVLNFGVFLLAYLVLTQRDVPWRAAFPGALFAAVAWSVLQAIGTLYVSHTLKHATQVYGLFGFVIGLLTWIYLGAQILLLGAEINVVRAKHLWPRSLRQPPLTAADQETFMRKAGVEERIPQESVDVTFAEPRDKESESRAAGGVD